MQRRELLKMIMAATGVAMVGHSAFAYVLKSPVPLTDTVFNQGDVDLFNDIAERILPRTDTPGAKDANVGLMALILANDCYSKTERDAFIVGFNSINTQCQARFGQGFSSLSMSDQNAFLQDLDQAASAYNKKQDLYYLSTAPFDKNRDSTDPTPHYFTLIKQLTIFTFFTSKVGATEVLRYEAIPGKYNGELDYKKGDRAWAT